MEDDSLLAKVEQGGRLLDGGNVLREGARSDKLAAVVHNRDTPEQFVEQGFSLREAQTAQRVNRRPRRGTTRLILNSSVVLERRTHHGERHHADVLQQGPDVRPGVGEREAGAHGPLLRLHRRHFRYQEHLPLVAVVFGNGVGARFARHD